MKHQNLLLVVLCGLFAFGPAFAADPVTPANDAEADRVLREASVLLASAKSFSFKAEVWEDAVVFGHKVSTTKTVVMQLRRPDRLRAEVSSPKFSRGFWYDGKSLTLLARVANLYGTVAVPATIDKVIDEANDKYGINFPLEDLLVSDPYASAKTAIKGAGFFGKVTMLGTPCQHIAFSTDKVDLQLWVQTGPKPLVRKLVITYKQEPTAPQYTAILSDWELSGELPDSTFAFTPPEGAIKVEVLPAADNE